MHIEYLCHVIQTPTATEAEVSTAVDQLLELAYDAGYTNEHHAFDTFVKHNSKQTKVYLAITEA